MNREATNAARPRTTKSTRGSRAFTASLPQLSNGDKSSEATGLNLVLESFSMTERLSSPFAMQARVSTPEALLPDDVIGKNFVIHTFVSRHSDLPVQERRFSGMVARCSEEALDFDGARFFYELEVVPWLWLLSQRADCRIFQQMSPLQVVLEVFEEYSQRFPHVVNYSDFTRDAGRDVRDCIVQYNESDLDFVSRLLEEEGIYYYFEYGDTNHTLSLRDNPHRFDNVPGQETARHLGDSGNRENEDILLSWREGVAITSGSYAVGDHHFLLANNGDDGRLSLAGPTKFSKARNSKLEVFEYPGGFAKQFSELQKDAGVLSDRCRSTADLRIAAEESKQIVVEGTSHCRAFLPGFQFHRKTPEGLADANGPYVLTEVHHCLSQEAFDRDGRRFDYHNRFNCIPTSRPFRPARLTKRPVIEGVQTAVVTGPDEDDPQHAEEIHVDEHGRVNVRFHWDRRGAMDDGRTSAWIRVGQGWASGGFGMHFWPRVGDEVIVAFLCGDPDRPLIVGSVYNAKNRPPYDLPAEKTKCGIKTRSTKGGDRVNFNEIRFEDRKGHEQVYIHAERNLSTVVEASESRSVGASRTTTIGHDDRLTVKKGNRSADVEEGSDLLSVLKGNRLVTVDKGDDFLQVPLGTRRVETDKYELVATSSINLNVGASNILLEPDCITLSVAGTTMKLDGSSIEAFAAMMKSVACGQHDIQGFPVKINC